VFLLQRQKLAWQMLREMMVHTLAEEAVLYPVVAEQVSLESYSDCIQALSTVVHYTGCRHLDTRAWRKQFTARNGMVMAAGCRSCVPMALVLL
jgi:hypothetical protein